MMSQVHYLGHTVSSEGTQPTQEKVQANWDILTPSDLYQLESFFGLFNFYAKFLLNLIVHCFSTTIFFQPWSYGPKQQRAFHWVKQQLMSTSLLVHYSDQNDLLLAADASPYRVAQCCLATCKADPKSWLLLPAKHRYFLLDKEALAIIFAVTKLHQYPVCLVITLQFCQTTNRSVTYLPQASQFQLWLQLVFRNGLYYSELRTTPFVTNLEKLTAINADTLNHLP